MESVAREQETVNRKPSTIEKAEVEAMIGAFEQRVANIARSFRFKFHPDGGFCQRWDMIMIFSLFYTALVTPYEVAFIPTQLDLRFGLNRFIDFLFAADMVFAFLLMYKDKTGRLIRDRKKIGHRYLRSYFMLDLLSMLPYDSFQYMTDKVIAEDSIQILRLIRLLRLVKLLRILRASRIFQRCEMRVGFQHSTVLAVKLMVAIGMANHWLACAWGLTAYLQSPATTTWFSVWLDGQTTKSECTTEFHMHRNAAFREGCWAHSDAYIASLYWAMMTVRVIS
jgi:potassium voltage-gated channel Eag-related subfamily H protein 7